MHGGAAVRNDVDDDVDGGGGGPGRRQPGGHGGGFFPIAAASVLAVRSPPLVSSVPQKLARAAVILIGGAGRRRHTCRGKKNELTHTTGTILCSCILYAHIVCVLYPPAENIPVHYTTKLVEGRRRAVYYSVRWGDVGLRPSLKANSVRCCARRLLQFVLVCLDFFSFCIESVFTRSCAFDCWPTLVYKKK